MQTSETKSSVQGEFALLLGAAAAALVLDVESTKYAQRDPEAAEINSWIYGERPSRARMYAVSIPVTLALVAWASYLKKNSSADAKRQWAWRFPLLALSVGHSIGAAANYVNFRQSPQR